MDNGYNALRAALIMIFAIFGGGSACILVIGILYKLGIISCL